MSRIIFGRENGIRRRVVRKIINLLSGGSNNSNDNKTNVSSSMHQASSESIERSAVPEPPKDVTPPDGYEVVLHKDALQSGALKEVIVAGKAIAITQVGESYFAFENECPHAQGPLSEGHIDEQTLEVTCPYHSWRFSIEDGRSSTMEGACIESYSVHLEGDAICVEV
jgi:nitrite reductase (NADH) small subunit